MPSSFMMPRQPFHFTYASYVYTIYGDYYATLEISFSCSHYISLFFSYGHYLFSIDFSPLFITYAERRHADAFERHAVIGAP